MQRRPNATVFMKVSTTSAMPGQGSWSDRTRAAIGAAARRRGVPRWVDVTMASVLFLGAALGGGAYWKRIASIGQPFYYQNYFEPAVMIGCARGFVVARPQVPEMVPFLWRQADRFSCDAIPANAPLGTDDMFQQGSWRYLMLAVGYTWRLFGVSWIALGPLFAALFGGSVAAVYAIFRLGMGPVLAVLGAIALSVSELHLKYLFSLRDYAKAPFALVLMFLLGLLVVRRVTSKGVLTIAALYGAVLAVGYGFRTDFTADIPPFLIALALFLDGGVRRHLRLKAAAGALCIATFLVVAWPVISTLDQSRPGCQWHVVLMGFAKQFDVPLGVGAAPYEVSREYLDEWAYTNVTSYAGRVQPGLGHIPYCELPYGAATRRYLLDVVTRMPADVIVRAYASVLRIAELPFAPVPGHEDENGPPPDLDAGHGVGLIVVIAATALVSAADMRLGLFLVFFLMYFAGMPAIQFDHRHFFHLEFITWWATGFLIQSAFADVGPLMRSAATRAIALRSAVRSACTLTACFIVLVVVLWAARAYQQPGMRSLLNEYVTASREPIPLAQVLSSVPAIRVSPHTDPETADFIAVDLNGSLCGPHAAVAFRYEEGPRRPYGRSFDVPAGARAAGLTEIFMPIYDGFRRIELSDAPPGCVDGVYRIRDARKFPLLLEATLTPGWRRMPLFQRLGG
jgi:hypothetical protein